jgi:ABC-2 type transport system permease protein
MSGLFTPIESMSRWVQPLSMLNPVRHFVTISRAVLIKGAGPGEIAEPLLFLTAFAAIMLTIAIRQYAKRTS